MYGQHADRQIEIVQKLAACHLAADHAVEQHPDLAAVQQAERFAGLNHAFRCNFVTVHQHDTSMVGLDFAEFEVELPGEDRKEKMKGRINTA